MVQPPEAGVGFSVLLTLERPAGFSRRFVLLSPVIGEKRSGSMYSKTLAVWVVGPHWSGGEIFSKITENWVTSTLVICGAPTDSV